uniref:NADH dehydrogenase subunit 4L n=1 Tax=Vermiviatum covidum TaxID=3348911 RepID=A0A8K1X7F1_9PLAT|nr:NADH dehydrogenase subunit 4L [Humbertium sp. MNHN JL090]
MWIFSFNDFLIFFFFFYLFLFYYYSFRFLNFLVSVEISLVFLFLFFSVFIGYGEMNFMLIFLSIIACGVAIGLSVMVSWMRFFDKTVYSLSTISSL